MDSWVSLKCGLPGFSTREVGWRDFPLFRKRMRKDGDLLAVEEVENAVLTDHAHKKFTTPWVFYNPKTDTHYREDFDTGWYSALKKAEIFGVRFHDLRHSTASHLIMSGASLKDVQEALGHKRIDTTLRYAHLSPQHRRSVMQRLDRVLSPARSVAKV